MPACNLVSVVIPTYNRADLVCAAIDSALAQTHPEVEIIVVDDGSTDDTAARLAGYGNRIRVMRQSNAGVCAARNAGFAAAYGRFVALLDSDDRWLPWKLAAQVEAFRCHPELQMVYTDISVIDRSGTILRHSCLSRFYAPYDLFPQDKVFTTTATVSIGPEGQHVPLRIGNLSSLTFMGNCFHLSSTLLPTELMRRLGGFDMRVGNAGEDYEFFSRVARNGPVGLVDACATLCATRGLDNLSLLSTHTALANLETIEKIERSLGGELRLPAAMVAERRRSSVAWAGLSLFDDDRFVEARPYLRRALAMGSRRPRVLAYWLLSRLPPSVIQVARAMYQWAKHRRLADAHSRIGS